MATFNNIDRYVFFCGGANPFSGGRGDYQDVSELIFSYDSTNRVIDDLAKFLVYNTDHGDGGFEIRKTPPAPHLVITDDDPSKLLKSTIDCLDGAFDLDPDGILPESLDQMVLLEIASKHKIKIRSSLIEWIAASDNDNPRDWSDPSVVEASVIEMKEFKAKKKDSKKAKNQP